MKKNGYLILLLLFIGCHDNHTPKKIHIYGEFPVIKDAWVRLGFDRNGMRKEMKVDIEAGKFDFYVDSAETGEYSFTVNWPVPLRKRHQPTSNDQEKSFFEQIPPGIMTRFSLSKEMYINPDQALDYHIRPEKVITPQMINEFTTADYDRPDRFRLQLTTESEDAQYFERLDSLTQYYKGMNIYLIMDSLQTHMDSLPQGRNAVRDLARQINTERNYTTYMKARQHLAHQYPGNPIGALDILQVSNEQLMKNTASYTALLDNMVGRAKASEYYTLAREKLSALSAPVKMGGLLEWPEGQTPEGDVFRADPADHRFTLFEFWASWCIPCREQNPEWNALLSAYGKRGFRMLGISLDNNRSYWQQAIANDHLSDWLHVSDLGAFRGINAIRYGVEFIPYNILVESSGRVAALEITPDELAELLESELN